MKTLKLTIQGRDVVRFYGADLDNRPAAPTHWTRFSAVHLRTGHDQWLRFDVEADTDDPPADLNQEKDDHGFSTVVFSPSTNAGDVWEIHKVKSWVVLRFRWRNPLTPASEGAWIRLILKRDHDALFVVATDEKGGNDSRVWTFDDRWWSKPLPANLNPPAFATALASYSYSAADGRRCELLDRQSEQWLLDASRVEKLRERFRLVFLAEAGGIRPLAARFESSVGLHPVNARALTTEPFSSVSLDAGKVDLTCARRMDGAGFIVEWISVADSVATTARELSLDTMYQALARHYTLGLASARSRNRLTFAPTRLLAKSVRLHFDAGPATLLREVIVDAGTEITWVTGGAGEAGKAAELRFTQTDATPRRSLREVIADPGEPAVILGVNGKGQSIEARRWVVNGVALDVDTLAEATLEIRKAGEGTETYGQSPIAVRFSLDFSSASIEPVSDDPEIGFETVSAWLQRERPIVIDLRTTNPRVGLEIREFADASQSRVLRIGVRSLSDTRSSYDIDALVLDPSPFTAARVRSTTDVGPRELLAEYTDDSDQTPEWAFASAKGEMRVTLPPQVIGEEMVKGRLFATIDGSQQEVPLAGKPFDFRLSPAALLTLDRTDIDTARALAPWSLRRLLAQRPGVVGAKLDKARFELLYGLLTTIDDVSGLRIADLEALVGRIPLPDEFLELIRRGRERKKPGTKEAESPDALLELRTAYADLIAACIRGMLYRPSRWPVFRDFTSRQQLTISGRGVGSVLRPTRATASPFEIGTPHDLLTVRDNRTPLRGGVDWPFQSRAVYNELKSRPMSSSVAIEGLAFGTLGGWGKQTAAFNDGKTLIISETTLGRLDSVTVIRLGRIAMLWNRARHVIVYERSTRRAPRYQTDPETEGDTWEYQSGAFDGLAALRKVREYIEVTEQKRTYPDTATSQPIAGPLRASFFETTVIPVKSSWGRDVDSGFVIALRGPMKEEEEKFFPMPKIFLKKARARGKGEGTVDHQLRDPGELLFYTSTRSEDGGDSDQWPAVPDIDFPLVTPHFMPPLPFRSRFTRSRKQPGARTSDFGQTRFTVTVDAPEEAVDLMYGRLSEGIEARVSSVSLARGRIAAGDAPTGVGAKLVDPMAQTHALLHDGLSELRMQIAQARNDGLTSLTDNPAFAEEARRAVRELRVVATDLADKAKNQTVKAFNWKNEQEEWNSKYQANVTGQLEAWSKQLDVRSIEDADERKRIGRSALNNVCQQIRQRVNEANFLPLQALERIDVARKSLEKRFADFEKRVVGDFKAAVDRLASRYREIVAASGEEIGDDGVLPVIPGLIELQKEVDAVLADFQAVLVRVDDDAIRNLIDNLGEWFSVGSTGVIADLTRPIRELADELRLLAGELVSTVSPIAVEEPDWEQLKQDCESVITSFASTLLPLLDRPIATLRAPIEDLLAGGRLEILDTTDEAIERACSELAGVIDDVEKVAGFIETVRTSLNGIGTVLVNALTNLGADWDAAPGPFDKLGEFAKDASGWFDSLGQALDLGSLDEIEAAVTSASKTIVDGLDRAARQVERAVVDELRNLGAGVRGAGLEVTRILATGPVNDAIACTRDQLGYYYEAAKDALDVTRASAIFNDLGGTVLNSLSAELPFDRLRDRLLPKLDGLDLGQLLPNFGGLKLEHLFPDLKAPNDLRSDNDWIRIRHGFDKDRLTAFANVDVDKVIDGAPAVFVLPPISLKIRDAHFLASSRLELSGAGVKSQTTKASLRGDWMLCLSDRPLVTMRAASLFYDSSGGFDFAIDSEKIELAAEFQFITQALKSLLPQDEGLTLTPIMPAGIRAELGLPLPDLTTGAFTLTGLTLFTYMELRITDGFEVRTGFWLSKPERPFGLAILFLGGGGWVGMEVSYRPPDRFITRVSIGISAGAFVAVNFGVARGSAGILFTAGVDFFRNWQTQGGQTLVTLGILVWGEFSILGIASASLRLMLSVTYDADNGRMYGTGRVEVSIKICWCFTLRVSQTVTQNFVGGNKQSSRALPASAGTRDRFQTAIRTVHSNVAL